MLNNTQWNCCNCTNSESSALLQATTKYSLLFPNDIKIYSCLPSLHCIKFKLSIKFHNLKREPQSELRFQNFNIFILHHCRLEEECLRGKSKLKMRLKSDVNIISFNSSQFSRNSLHCHLGTNQINKQNI